MPRSGLINVTTTGAALGAEVHEFDPRTIDDNVFDAIYRAGLDYQELLF